MSASTQNQALSAILFLYAVVLGQQLAWIQIRDKRRHFPLAELSGMALAVKHDEPPNPRDVCRLGPSTVVPEANRLTHLVEGVSGAIRLGTREAGQARE